MSESMRGLKRSHMCAEVTEKLLGSEVTVMGWVNKRRDIGKLIFIALRDRTGLVQIFVDTEKVSEEIFKKAEEIRGEYVLAVKGTVMARAEDQINPNMETGKIEILASEIRVLSEAEVPPFQVLDKGVNTEMRLKYRYLDLRRPELQKTFILRHKAAQTVRRFLSDNGFLEIETPVMTKSTPEGARDYLVPSRIYPGNFYALPQSPQVFKQLLMVSGFDRYFQIVRCFRDEDLRADRQPEFTQIDIEMSFVDQEDVISVNERLIQALFKETVGYDIKLPIPRITYKEAMERFGVDKPDLRYGMEINNITDIVNGSEFAAFQGAIDSGGSVRGICAKGCAAYSRKQIDALGETAKLFKAKGLMWIAISESGEYKTTLSKFFGDDRLQEICDRFGAKSGDLVLITADADNEIVLTALGNIRTEVAAKQNLYKEGYEFVWVTEFPLLEWSEEDGRFYAKHHPFTSPMDEDIELFKSNPKEMRAKAYDLVINGYEAGGGSIRIYQKEVQEMMFNTLGISSEDAYRRFSHILNAFKYGAPPHGGIAFGLDRLIMLLANEPDIRDVIAFPKVKDASCLLTDAPSTVDAKQLEELGLAVTRLAEKN